MLHPILVNHMLWIPPGIECSSEDLLKLLVKSTNAKFLEVKVLFEDLLLLHFLRNKLQDLSLRTHNRIVQESLRLNHSIAQSAIAFSE